ncbi:MAG: hypothetical protein ABS55_01710 [Lautropia sp. SCN 70-15]|nr:MAG: hypothetical protein ABS55_01710 [Lautropia sp. SCN 70-15]
MTPQQALQLAGLPEARHAEALASIARAKAAKRGLLAHKLKARWLHAGDIADALAWADERLCTVRPDMARWDIAPMLNVTAHGDNGPWAPDGSRPLSGYWLDADPQSAEYLAAVEANYWLPGTHPRSKASRKAWYRRNAGEYEAWARGAAIDPANGFEIWRGERGRTRVIVWQCSGAWLVKTSFRLVGDLAINTRRGYEIDNVFSGDYTPQMWFPVPGYELKAPVTWSTVPGRWMSLTRKRWEKQ